MRFGARLAIAASLAALVFPATPATARTPSGTSGQLYYEPADENALLQYSFRTRHITTVVTDTHETTGIVRVRNRLIWAEFGHRPCHGDPGAGAIFILSLKKESPVREPLLHCIHGGSAGLVAHAGFIYFATEHGIGRVRFDGSEPERHYIKLRTQPGGSAVDGLVSDGRALFFSECMRGAIGRVDFDRADLQYRFAATGHKSCPQALAVGGGWLYWSELGPIGRVRLDGSRLSRGWLHTHTSGGFNLAADAHHVYWDWCAGPQCVPSFIGRANTNLRHVTKRWQRGQGAMLLTTRSANR